MSFQISAQSPHPYFHNYTTNNGLPSSEVHYTLEDDDGYMWFATDNGVSRFDGYSFKNFGPKEGLKHPVAFFLQKAADGTIWIATLNGHLYFVKGERILAFEQNEVINKYAQEGKTLFDFYIDPSTATKYISIIGSGVLAFDRDDNFKLVYKSSRRRISLIRDNIFLSETSTKEIDYNLVKYSDIFPNSFDIIMDTIVTVDGIVQEKKVASDFGQIMFKNSKDLYFFSQYLFEIEAGSVESVLKKEFAFFNKSIFIKDNGKVIIGFQSGGGLAIIDNAQELIDGDFIQFLAGKSIAHIFEDSKGALWISTIENGVFYISNFEQKIFDASSGLSTDHVSAIAIKNENEFFIGLRNADLYLQNISTNKLVELPKAPKYYNIVNDIFYDKKQETLWAGFNSIAQFKNGKWTVLPTIKFNDKQNSGLISKRLSLGRNSSILWGVNPNSFGAVDLSTKEKHFSSIDIGLRERTFCIKESLNGRIWIGSGNGLLEFKNNELIPQQISNNAFDLRIEDLDELQDTTLVIATKGAGVLLWKENYFHQFTRADGLTSDMIENIHVDDSGKIWAGTLSGLNTIMPTDTGYQIKNYSMWHGLPSNEITQVRSYGEQVWVATTKGLLQWVDPKPILEIPKSIIEYVYINNEEIQIDAHKEFSYQQNNFRFHFLAINYQMQAKIPYRFRLNKGPWNLTQDRTASYANLAADNYIFEVQAQAENGIWSPSTDYQFKIKPPWWATWWFRLIAILMIAGAIFIWYNNRTKRFRKETELLQEINELERKALQAQMNPHFIFNCLNAIQNAILQKEDDQAVTYLTKFAAFTRWVLKSSVDGKVLLEEELNFLENYLSLEKLRFKNKFIFKFEIDEELSLIDTYVMPLMIQPIVENAIKHGMKNIKDNGIINLSFTDAEDSIYIKVRDNGHGIIPKEKKPSIYQPMGMSITKRRLEVAGEEIPMKFTTLKDKDGNIEGTEVAFFLKKI